MCYYTRISSSSLAFRIASKKIKKPHIPAFGYPGSPPVRSDTCIPHTVGHLACTNSGSGSQHISHPIFVATACTGYHFHFHFSICYFAAYVLAHIHAKSPRRLSLARSSHPLFAIYPHISTLARTHMPPPPVSCIIMFYRTIIPPVPPLLAFIDVVMMAFPHISPYHYASPLPLTLHSSQSCFCCLQRHALGNVRVACWLEGLCYGWTIVIYTVE